MRVLRVLSWLLGLGVALAPACTSAQPRTLGDRYDLERFQVRHDMPGRLDEISGLALSADGRLFTNNDERAVIYEVDLQTGRATRGFSLGDRAVRADFEGLAVVGDRFFLIASTGILYEFREAPIESSTRYRVTDTGLGRRCEAEGLAHDPADSTLLVACKTSAPDETHAVVHRLPLDPARGALDPIRISKERIRDMGGKKDFNPSGVAVDPDTGHLVLVAARQEVLVEATLDGEVVSVVRLSKSRHPQPEGVEFTPSGLLLIADEKNGNDAGVTAYARR
jgi:uncharacterized protein YjiK